MITTIYDGDIFYEKRNGINFELDLLSFSTLSEQTILLQLVEQ